MKIYFSARYSRLPELQGYAKELELLGHIVTSRWVEGQHQNFDRDSLEPGNRGAATAHLASSLGDLTTADAVVSFTEEPGAQTLGGRHVELGVAIAMDKTVFVIGPVENLFYLLAEDSRFDNFGQFVSWLRIHTSRYGPNELAVQSVINLARDMDADTIDSLCREMVAGPASPMSRVYLSNVDDMYAENIWHDAINAFHKNANCHGFFGDVVLQAAIRLASAALAEAYRDVLTEDDYLAYTLVCRRFAQQEESQSAEALG
jgi:hypothetical protein